MASNILCVRQTQKYDLIEFFRACSIWLLLLTPLKLQLSKKTSKMIDKGERPAVFIWGGHLGSSDLNLLDAFLKDSVV